MKKPGPIALRGHVGKLADDFLDVGHLTSFEVGHEPPRQLTTVMVDKPAFTVSCLNSDIASAIKRAFVPTSGQV